MPYNWFALSTLTCWSVVSQGNPFGYWSLRSGGGRFCSLFWINRALLEVPHGGAKCTYTQALLQIKLSTCAKWDGLSRSSLRIGPFKRFGRTESTPMLSTSPSARKLAVSRAVPAYISKAKKWLTGCPCSFEFWVKLLLLQWCCCSEWCLKHPGSAHTCSPLEQASPGLAALHPFGKLNAQHNLFFCGVSRAFPIRAFGTLGPRPFFDFPLPRPLFLG